MVLPLIIGVGVTLLAVSARSGFRAWSIYKNLTPLMIAQLNNIKINENFAESYRFQFHNDKRFDSNKINSQIKQSLEINNIGGFFNRMTEAEALLILDISPQEIKKLNIQLVKKKHRNAIIRNHPDKGGSPFITAKINEARELILKSPLVK